MKRLLVYQSVIAAVTVGILGAWFVANSPTAAAHDPAAPVTQVSRGQELYDRYCAPCHGLAGDGAGPGAERLFVKPRDFTRDEYKIKSTVGEEFPSREDLIQVIAEGMPGSSMPGWKGVLTQAEMGELADYMQTFGRFFPQEGYGANAIDVPGRVNPSAESIARGRELYESDIECLKCHGEAGRGDGPSALEQTDNAGDVIYPADLTQPWTFRGGAEPEDIYLRLQTGLTGSSMPSFADALSPEETWDLVNYILSLSPGQPPEPAVILVSQFMAGPLPESPDDPAWQEPAPAYYPLTAQLLHAPRYYHSSVNAVLVRSLYNESEIAFHVTWNDRTETRTGETVDAMAIQFPQELSESDERPHFAFGDPERAVYQWYWAAGDDVTVERNGHGADAIEVQPQEQRQTRATASYQAGRWQLVFRRPLGTPDGADLAFVTDHFIPVSFMVWDGYADEVDDKLGLTSWSVVYLQSSLPAVQYAWIPGVMAAVVVAELAVVWLFRRSAQAGQKG